MHAQLKKNIGYAGFWVFNIVNLLVCLGIITGVPYLFWRIGAHWTWVVLSAVAGFFGTGFLAEHVLFKLTWADRLFGELKDPHGKSVSWEEHARQAKK